jgi:hypothetical protein
VGAALGPEPREQVGIDLVLHGAPVEPTDGRHSRTLSCNVLAFES